MSASAPGTSGASVTSTMRPPRGILTAVEVVECSRPRRRALAGARRAAPSSGEMYGPSMWMPAIAGSRHACEHARARREIVERRRDERRQARVTPTARIRSSASADAIGGQVGGVEIDAGKAIDLKIEEARELDPHDSVAVDAPAPRVAGFRLRRRLRDRDRP